MAIDSSVYGMLRGPDIAGAIEQGMRLRDMADQRKEKKARKEAYAAGLVQNPDGTTTVDKGKTFAALAGGGFGEEAQEYERQMQAENTQRFASEAKKAELIGQAVGGIKDQTSYSQVRNQLLNSGQFNEKEIPEAYDPGFVATAARRSQAFMDQFNKDRAFGLKERELGIKNKLADQKVAQRTNKRSVAADTVDREFGKEYHQWTSGGGARARSEIEKLRAVAESLGSGKVTTGGLTGVFSDRITSTGVLRARADVNSTVMNSLRAILGPQFTEKEGERIIKNTWNESDSTENNVVRINRLIGDLTAQADAKDMKSKFYEDRGSLEGFKAGSSNIARERSAPRTEAGSGGFGIDKANASSKPQVFKANEIEWAD